MYLIINITLAHVIILCNVHPSFYELQILMNTFATIMISFFAKYSLLVITI